MKKVCYFLFDYQLSLISGNPVFSILQTDAIVYGSDLPTFIRNELTDYEPCHVAPKEIPFWSNLAGETPVIEGYSDDDSESSDDEDESSPAGQPPNPAQLLLEAAAKQQKS